MHTAHISDIADEEKDKICYLQRASENDRERERERERV